MAKKRKTVLAAVARSPAKRSANLSIDAALLREARALDINLSQALEQRLVELVRDEKRRRWRAENEAAIADYNERVGRDGIFSWRRF
ncbi:MAG TPA: type II toxin-antitoxin system CcdA family antitoxin [Stellaceae bacterium]|nr:type II toxin-antitoxin system CcdA family antitoxin [Stellaceae bacterium]